MARGLNDRGSVPGSGSFGMGMGGSDQLAPSTRGGEPLQITPSGSRTPSKRSASGKPTSGTKPQRQPANYGSVPKPNNTVPSRPNPKPFSPDGPKVRQARATNSRFLPTNPEPRRSGPAMDRGRAGRQALGLRGPVRPIQQGRASTPARTRPAPQSRVTRSGGRGKGR